MSLQLGKVVAYGLAGWIPGGPLRCAACNNAVWRFMPYRKGARRLPPLMRALEIVGSDVDNFECPRCGAHDRERHLLLYLHASGMLEWMKGRSILHFAPEKRLSRWIQAAGPADYTACDLYPQASHVRRVDMLDMDIGTASVDMLIANHVLEHVEDIDRALGEIFRVLKPGGHAILQTPYSKKLHATWEDTGVDTPQARLQAYGQEDHVRLFGRDIVNRFARSGLVPRVQTHDALLPECDVIRHGVNPAEPFFLFHKAV